MRKETLYGLALAAALAVAVAGFIPGAAAQSYEGGPGPGYGPGMMGWGGGYGPGYGPGMMEGYGPGYGPGMMGGYGPGMMGGYGPGMMGWGGGYGPGYGPGYYGYGPGVMGPGMMGPGWGWMGPGMMYGYGPGGWGQPQQADLNLTVDQAKTQMDSWVKATGNPHIKLGKVAEKDADTITADVVTTDKDALVQRYDINRHTGAIQPAGE